MYYEITDRELRDHFKAALKDAEALVEATADLGGEKIASVRARAEESLRLLKVRTTDAQAALGIKAQAAASVTDAYVRESPWEAIGLAAGVGILIGVLAARRA